MFFIQIQYTVHPKQYAESLLFIEFHTDVFKGYFTDMGALGVCVKIGQSFACPMPVKQPWRLCLIWTHEIPKKDDVTTTRQCKIESYA